MGNRACNELTDGPLLMSPEALAKSLLENLPRAALGQLARQKLHAARNLVARQKPAAMRDQLIDVDSGAGLQHHASHHELSPLWVRYPKDRCLTNGRMLVNDGFDLCGVHILAARDDHVLQAIQNIDKAISILIADVAGTKHPLPKCELGLIEAIPVTVHHIRTTDDQLTRPSDGNILACGIY